MVRGRRQWRVRDHGAHSDPTSVYSSRYVRHYRPASVRRVLFQDNRLIDIQELHVRDVSHALIPTDAPLARLGLTLTLVKP